LSQRSTLLIHDIVIKLLMGHGQRSKHVCGYYSNMQILADAIKAQTAELRSSVDSMKEMLKKYERGRSGSDSKDSITLPELRQELRSFASTLNE